MARYNPDDPYDLKIVEYGKIKSDNLKEYYTLRFYLIIIVKKDFANLWAPNLLILCLWNNGLKNVIILMKSKDSHFSLNLENGKPWKCGGLMLRDIKLQFVRNF